MWVVYYLNTHIHTDNLGCLIILNYLRQKQTCIIKSTSVLGHLVDDHEK